MSRKQKIRNIYTSNPYDFNENDVREEWMELAEINNWDIPEDGPSDTDLWELWNEKCNNDLDDLKAEIDAHKEEGSYLVIASLGLWDGRFPGGKIIEGSLYNAIIECFEDYNRIYMEGKQLKVDAIHHDGTNHFIIKKLTDRGIEFYNNHYYDYDDRTMHQKLFKDAHYTHSVDFFARIYGWVKDRKKVK